MSLPRPELELVIQLYGSCLPDYDFILRQYETNGRRIRFSKRLHEATARLKCQHYPELYQEEARIQTALLRAFFQSDEEIKQFLADLASYSLEEQTRLLNDHLRDAMDYGEWFDKHLVRLDDLDWSPEGQAKAQLEWEKLSPEEQHQGIRVIQFLLMFGLASFHNYFALMVHGKKLTQLVREAMAENEDSFCLAIHIDKSILFQTPYFKDRYQRAQQDGEEEFLKAVSYRLHLPQLQGKIQHRLLYMLFALLDGTYWLDHLKHREILDICDRLGLDRYENRIETENALTKRLKEYRDFQKIKLMSMP